MDNVKQMQVFKQYIDQYQPVIHSTLNALRNNKNALHIPYAEFLFSIIDYYGLLHAVATTRHFNKRDKNNFLTFFSSDYFPQTVRCKSSFLYFVRNGIIHQIFSKASAVGTSTEKTLFFKDNTNGDIAALNLDYLDNVTMQAIDAFIIDLKSNAIYIDNLHDMLIKNNYAFNDHDELSKELRTNFNDDINNIFGDCI